jgi:WD40 repeat protein
VRVDREGIRLPPDAFSRLGSARFRHPAPVDYLAFAPDGKAIAVAHVGGVTIWETATGRPTQRIEWHSGRISRVTFAADGRTVHAIAETAPHKWSLVSFDVSTGTEQHRVAIRENFVPFPLDLGWLDNSFASLDVVLFDPASGRDLARVSNLPGIIVGFSPDGRRVVVFMGDDTYVLFDLLRGKQLEKFTLKGFRARRVWPLPDGWLLISGDEILMRWHPTRKVVGWKRGQGFPLILSRDGKLIVDYSYGPRLIDAETGRTIWRADRASESSSFRAWFSPDGKILATGDRLGAVLLRDTATGKILPQSADPAGWIKSIQFTDDGRLAGQANDWWTVWDLDRPDRSTRLAGPTADWIDLAPTGHVAADWNGERPVFFDPQQGGNRRALDRPPPAGFPPLWSRFSEDGKRYICALSPSPEEPTLSSGYSARGITVWDCKTGKRGRTLSGRLFDLVPLAVSPTGDAVVVRYWSELFELNSFAIWEPDTGKCRWALPYTLPFGMDPWFIGFADHGSRLVIQEGPSEPFHILDAKTGKEISQIKGPEVAPEREQRTVLLTHMIPTARAISQDGRLVAVSDSEGKIIIWDLHTDREHHRLVCGDPARELAFSRDRRWLAVASASGPVVVYALPQDEK